MNALDIGATIGALGRATKSGESLRAGPHVEAFRMSTVDLLLVQMNLQHCSSCMGDLCFFLQKLDPIFSETGIM